MSMRDDRLEALLSGDPGATSEERGTATLIAELRATRPQASAHLRERVVAAAAAAPPARAPRFARLSGLPRRRVALVLVPAIVAAALGAVALRGVVQGGGGRPSAVTGLPEAATDQATKSASALPAAPTIAQGSAIAGSAVRSSTPLPANPNRVQSYHAELALLVPNRDALSRSTLAAMQIARGLGGYLVNVSYGTAASSGSSELRLRIPVSHVQTAIVRLSALGTILAQDVRITDLQRQVNDSYRRLAQLRATVAKIEAKLAQPGLSDADQNKLNAQLAFAQAQIAAVTAARDTLVRNAQYATIGLSLTTRQPVVTPTHTSRLGRAEHNVRTALEAIAVALLYAIAIGGPILLLAGAAVLGARALRRRSDQRLLDKS
jgi:hypothetical protein